MTGPVARAIAVTFDDATARPEVAGLCAHVAAELAERGGDAVIVCHVARASPCLATIDALARLQIVARRHGARLELRGTSVELRRLLMITGLLGVLPG